MAKRTVTDGVTTAGSPTVTSASAAFAPGEVGTLITGPGIPVPAYIGVRNSPTSVGLSSSPTVNVPLNATATAAGVSLTIGLSWGAGTDGVQAAALTGAFGDTPQANDVPRSGYTVLGHQAAGANPTSKNQTKATYSQHSAARTA